MNRMAITIKEARVEAKMTEKDLAKKCGLTASYIIQVESGKKIINEKIAERILKAMGTEMELGFQQDIDQEKTSVREVKKVEKKTEEIFYDIQPKDQWSDALSNIIKKFPVYALNSKKIVGHKQLPILNKKIEGHQWEKIMFVQVSNDEMSALRIKTDDIIMVYLTKDISNDCIYLFEMNGQKMIRVLRKEPNRRIRLYNGVKGAEPIFVDQGAIKLIGKCVKVEFQI